MNRCPQRITNFNGRIINTAWLRSFFVVVAFLLYPACQVLLAQKECVNPPLLTLGATSGSTCFATPFTVEGSTFGGSATLARITHNGRGNVTPAQVSSSPFSFTYMPSAEDAGKTVRVVVTTDNPLRAPCKAARDTFFLTVTNNLQPPEIGGINNPTCLVSAGSVTVTNLPADHSWSIRVDPGDWAINGSGPEASVGPLSAGDYTLTITSDSPCLQAATLTVEIAPQPPTPGAPVPGLITPPGCDVPAGAVTFGNLPSAGTWTLTRYPDGISIQGTGITAVVPGIPPGTYNYTVRNEAGCVSVFSNDVVIPSGPPVLTPPLIGKIEQPSAEKPAGSVTLTGLPASGTWEILMLPGILKYSGTGSSFTVTDLADGTYTFRVSGDAGCQSAESEEVTIVTPGKPVLVITDPQPVCEPGTADLTSPLITAGSTAGLTLTYWNDAEATNGIETPSAVPAGVYFIRGVTTAGFFDIKPVEVTGIERPIASAGEDQILTLVSATSLAATLQDGETGYWSADSSIAFADSNDPGTEVTGLKAGRNELLWIVSNNYCPADTGKLLITVGEPVVPTMITPNGDSKNEYFIIPGLESLGRTELKIFDRKGTMLFRSDDYDNLWNGVDYNESPLPGDTYFYSLTTAGGRSWSGFVIIRR